MNEEIMDILDLTPETVGMFDVTLCLGIIYYAKNPILALEKIASVTDEMVIIESCVINKGGNIPLAEFVETEFQGDPTVWWIPNQACLEAMVRRVGFKKISSVKWRGGRISHMGRIIVKGYKVDA